MHFILIILLFVLFNSVISHRQVNNISLEENEVEFKHTFEKLGRAIQRYLAS
jgi:hypothetical protein